MSGPEISGKRSTEHYNALKEAMAAHGLTLPNNVEPGRLVRMPGAGKPPSNNAGWLRLFPDGQGAVFGDWSQDVSEVWQARKPANEAEAKRWREMAEQARQEAEQERADKAHKAAQTAAHIWEQASAPDTLHGYLVSKQVEPHGLKQQGDDLLVPVMVDNKLSSLQRIATDGRKRFMLGGKIKGGYHLIGEPGERLIVCEGYSTGASLYEATGDAAVVAFTCGNLRAVAEAIRAKYPDAQIIIAADDDRNTDGNPGLRHATAAAEAVSGLLVTPGKAGDMNDLMQAEGAEAVRQRIEAAKPARVYGFRLLKFGDIKPRPMAWRVQGLAEDDSIVLIVGDPGGGKSFLALDLAFCIGTGREFHGRSVKQGPVVYVAGEGHNGLARRRRAWEIRNETEINNAPIFLSSGAANLGDPESTAEILSAIDATGQHPAVVVLDTLNRNMNGDENSTPDMRAFIVACDEIRQAFNCIVMLVHHTGHGDKTRARGSSVLHGAIDTTFMVGKDAAGIVTVECTRMKDGPTPEPFAFHLRTVELGFKNDDGTEATSAVLDPCAIPAAAPNTTRGKHQKAALAMLESMIDLHRENLQAGGHDQHDPAAAKVKVNDWRDACVKDGMPRNRWYDAKRALHDAREIEITTGGFVHLSGCPPL